MATLKELVLDMFSDYMDAEGIDEYVTHVEKKVKNELSKKIDVVESALKRISEWNGSSIRTVADDFYEDTYSDLGIGWAIRTYVGTAYFSHMGKDNHVEDILEDPSMFSSEKEMLDYQNLVSEIERPHSTSSKKMLSLFTAQNIGFDRLKKIPKGLFLTSDLGDAIGLASDRDRSVFRVRINAKDVIQTKKGKIQWYQVKSDSIGEIEKTSF